ncbi:MAG TPA: FecR domain-containing protein [Puia sp.]|nr:FecR domain-containing protein [Puia sp.]
MDDLLIKYVLGEATREEAAQVERWLEADAANRRRYEEYKTLWAVSRRTAARESAESKGSVDVQEAWQRLRSAPVGERSDRVRRLGWLRFAAAAIVILVFGGVYLLFSNHRPDVVRVPGVRPLRSARVGATEVPTMVKLGATRPGTDTLPDGTVVTLNRGASLAIVRSLAGDSAEKGLTVRLRGEGFFSVRHDPARAFVVQIGAVSIKVLGTSFEVNGDGDDSWNW